MKATGIVRHMDDLGRIVVPTEIRSDPLLKTLTVSDGYLWAMERLQKKL